MSVNITYQNQARTIHLSELPVFKETIAAQLQKTDAVKNNQILKEYDYTLTSTLKGRVESIETVRTALTEIQEHKTREVLCACLKTALACAIIAGIVLGAVFGPGEFAILIALLVGVVGTVVSSYITEKSCNRILQFIRRDHWNVQLPEDRGLVNPLCLITAPFAPLYEVLTRRDSIERLQTKQNTEMTKDLNTFLQFAGKLSENLEAIQKQLQGEQTTKERYIARITPQSKDSALSEAVEGAMTTLKAEIDVIQKTQEALTAFEAHRTKMLTEPVEE